MKSLSFFLIMALFMLGCSDSVSGHPIRHDGPLQAYEKRIQFDLNECEKHWQQELVNVATCNVDLVQNEKAFVWNAGRIIHFWEYTDNDWLVDISIYHTDKGYSLRMVGSNAEPVDYFNFEIAKKYLASAIENYRIQSVRQIHLLPKENKAPESSRSLGSVTFAKRKINIRNSALLELCKKRYSQGQCDIDVINGTHREALLEMQTKSFNLKNIWMKTNGFLAWTSGSGLSDYKITLGAHNSKLKFEEFRTLWLLEAPDLSISLKIQKFSRHLERPEYSETFVTYAKLNRIDFLYDISKCKIHFLVHDDFKSSCSYGLGFEAYPIYDIEILNGITDYKNSHYSVDIRIRDGQFYLAAFGSPNKLKKFNDFWAVLLSASLNDNPKSTLYMVPAHQ